MLWQKWLISPVASLLHVEWESTLTAVLLGAAEIILVVGVWICRGAGITAHWALSLALENTSLTDANTKVSIGGTAAMMSHAFMHPDVFLITVSIMSLTTHECEYEVVPICNMYNTSSLGPQINHNLVQSVRQYSTHRPRMYTKYAIWDTAMILTTALVWRTSPFCRQWREGCRGDWSEAQSQWAFGPSGWKCSVPWCWAQLAAHH